jgi:hypothetical protein
VLVRRSFVKVTVRLESHKRLFHPFLVHNEFLIFVTLLRLLLAPFLFSLLVGARIALSCLLLLQLLSHSELSPRLLS